MVGDYIATAYSNGRAFGVFAVAQANAGGVFSEAIYTTTNPLPQTSAVRRATVRAAMRAEPRQSPTAPTMGREGFTISTTNILSRAAESSRGSHPFPKLAPKIAIRPAPAFLPIALGLRFLVRMYLRAVVGSPDGVPAQW